MRLSCLNYISLNSNNTYCTENNNVDWKVWFLPIRWANVSNIYHGHVPDYKHQLFVPKSDRLHIPLNAEIRSIYTLLFTRLFTTCGCTVLGQGTAVLTCMLANTAASQICWRTSHIYVGRHKLSHIRWQTKVLTYMLADIISHIYVGRH